MDPWDRRMWSRRYDDDYYLSPPQLYAGPIYWVEWVDFDPLWAASMSWMDRDLFRAWKEWQDEIRNQNLDKFDRRRLLRATIRRCMPFLFTEEILRHVDQMIEMEDDLGADEYGHVNMNKDRDKNKDKTTAAATTTATTTTTTITVTQQQRQQFANRFLQELTNSGSTMGFEDATKIQNAILNGERDELVKQQLQSQQSGTSQPAQLQLPARQQQHQQSSVQLLQNTTTTTTNTTTSSSAGHQVQAQPMTPSYQQPGQNYAQPQYQHTLQGGQPMQQLAYQQPLQIAAGPSQNPSIPRQFAQQGYQGQQPMQNVHPQQQLPYQQPLQVTAGPSQSPGQYQQPLQTMPGSQYSGYPFSQSGYHQKPQSQGMQALQIPQTPQSPQYTPYGQQQLASQAYQQLYQQAGPHGQQQIAYSQPQSPAPGYQQALVPSSGQPVPVKEKKHKSHKHRT